MEDILLIDKPKGITSFDVIRRLRSNLGVKKIGHAGTLDPQATARVEELMRELKARYTIVIVTHNMQQAARVSDLTAFFYLGELIEMDETPKVFTNPQKKQTEDYITGRFG